jgi:hypothetical protein
MTCNQKVHDSKALSLDDFKKLNLNEKLISNGIVLLWSEKTYLMEIMEHMEEQGFSYIENFAFVYLSA